MSQIQSAVREFESIDELARRHTPINDIHPGIKLVVTVVYLVLVVSFNKYQVAGIMGMAIYPFILFNIADLSFGKALKKLRIVLPIVCLMGVFNPFFDRVVIGHIGGIPITAGVLSMITLMMKGILAVLASYLLIATTTIEGICYALRRFHVPKILVTEFMLICRYISVLGREADRMWVSYHMRAPSQKGINHKAWGSFVGLMLLRSMDRAETVFQSMQLRGFSEEFKLPVSTRLKPIDWEYLAGFISLFLILRFVPIFNIIGGIFI